MIIKNFNKLPENASQRQRIRKQKDDLIVRTANTIDIPSLGIQIVLRLYKSPSEVLHGFDVDSCCMGYDGKYVWMTRRCYYSLIHRFNTVNFDLMSPSYVYRLAKYGERGIAIYDKKFNRDEAICDDIRENIFKKSSGVNYILMDLECYQNVIERLNKPVNELIYKEFQKLLPEFRKEYYNQYKKKQKHINKINNSINIDDIEQININARTYKNINIQTSKEAKKMRINREYDPINEKITKYFDTMKNKHISYNHNINLQDKKNASEEDIIKWILIKKDYDYIKNIFGSNTLLYEIFSKQKTINLKNMDYKPYERELQGLNKLIYLEKRSIKILYDRRNKPSTVIVDQLCKEYSDYSISYNKHIISVDELYRNLRDPRNSKIINKMSHEKWLMTVGVLNICSGSEAHDRMFGDIYVNSIGDYWTLYGNDYLEDIINIPKDEYEYLGYISEWKIPKRVEFKTINPGEQMTNTFNKLVLEDEKQWYNGPYYKIK